MNKTMYIFVDHGGSNSSDEGEDHLDQEYVLCSEANFHHFKELMRVNAVKSQYSTPDCGSLLHHPQLNTQNRLQMVICNMRIDFTANFFGRVCAIN